jgi:hypothetical protein
MKGSRITGYILLFYAGVAFAGFLTGHPHTLFISVPAALVGAMLLSKKTFKR